jgi:hypothetical protein
MRLAFLSGLVFALAACGAPTAQAPETEEQFVSRCQSEQGGEEWTQAYCAEQWQNVVQSGAAADAVIAAVAPADGPIDAAALPARLTNIAWDARPARGASASGALDQFIVRIDSNPTSVLSFSWSEVGMPAPFDVPTALRARGVELQLVACQAFGASESTEVFVATPQSGAPFGLTIGRREAPTANANSHYVVQVDLSGVLPTTESTIGAARAQNDTSWDVTCEASNAQYQ